MNKLVNLIVELIENLPRLSKVLPKRLRKLPAKFLLMLTDKQLVVVEAKVVASDIEVVRYPKLEEFARKKLTEAITKELFEKDLINFERDLDVHRLTTIFKASTIVLKDRRT